VAFDLTGAPRQIGMDRQVVLVRAAQEALANARRHARATRVRVSLAYDETEVALTVVDDGTGFDPHAVDGYGLAGMRSRVERIGGRVDLHSVPGEGTTVRVVVP
jgi:signal transduction histidine kinase